MIEKKVKNDEEKKKYLKSYKDNVLAVNLIKEEIEQLELDKRCLLPKEDAFSSGEKLHSILILKKRIDQKTIEQQRFLTNKFNRYVTIIDSIEKLENETEKNVLKIKYIHCKTWEEVCEIMNYSYRQIHNIHKKALKNLLL